ncbi:MAG: four-carbon acid sugar kinase family protein [Nitrososphaeria archaeon]
MAVKIYRSVLVIADDLTGANDATAQFAKLGYSTVTTLDVDVIPELMKKYDVVAVDTESRALSADKAYDSLLMLGNRIRGCVDGTVLYKKIDSTLRGNITSEVKALRDALEPDLIVFAPAFPKQGRTTRDGVLMVGGVPVEQTYFGNDIRTPVKSSKLSSYFELEYGCDYLHVPLDDLRSGRLYEGSVLPKVLTFDVEDDEDLNMIVRSVCGLDDKSVIWVGSAGLAESVAYNIVVGSSQGKPILMAVGSVNDATRRQVQAFTEESDGRLLTVDVKALIEDFEREWVRLRNEISEALSSASDVILTISYTREQMEDGRSLAERLNVGLSEFGLMLAGRFGELISRIIHHFGQEKFGGLFMTGGDTAVAAIKSLGIDTLELKGEIEPGLPILKFKDMSIVTKAGGFGSMETLIKVAARLKAEGDG